MNKLSKIVLFFVVAVLFIALGTAVNAATNEELIGYLEAKFPVTEIPADIEAYLMKIEDKEVIDQIIANVEVIAELSVDDGTPITDEELAELKDLVKATAKLADITVKFDGTQITLTDKTGKQLGDPITEDDFDNALIDLDVELPKTEAEKKAEEDKNPSTKPGDDTTVTVKPDDDTTTKDPAKDAADDKKEDNTDSPKTGVVYVNIMVALVVVVAAACGIVYFAKKD